MIAECTLRDVNASIAVSTHKLAKETTGQVSNCSDIGNGDGISISISGHRDASKEISRAIRVSCYTAAHSDSSAQLTMQKYPKELALQ